MVPPGRTDLINPEKRTRMASRKTCPMYQSQSKAIVGRERERGTFTHPARPHFPGTGDTARSCMLKLYTMTGRYTR